MPELSYQTATEAVDTLGASCARYLDAQSFREAINKIRADAVRDAASGLVDWDIMYGHENPTTESIISHSNAAYLMRVADDFERGGH